MKIYRYVGGFVRWAEVRETSRFYMSDEPQHFFENQKRIRKDMPGVSTTKKGAIDYEIGLAKKSVTARKTRLKESQALVKKLKKLRRRSW